MDKPVRILHLVSLMNRAGQETFLMNIFRGINREKVQFDFLCTKLDKADFDDEIESLNGVIHRLSPNPLKNKKLLKHIGYCNSIYSFLKKHPEYNTFHIHTHHAFDAFLCALSAKLAGVNNVIIHCHNSSGPRPKLHKFFSFLLRFLKTKRFACSNDAAEWMFGSRFLEKGKVNIIKNGINSEDFVFNSYIREKTRKELGINNKIVIGHIGRLTYQKNHNFLLDVFQKIHIENSNTVLLLVGRGDLEEQIRDKVHNLGLDDSVIFTGVRSDIPDLLQAMDVFLFPSHFEGLGIVLIEAQAAGLKSFASDIIPKEAKVTNLLEFLSLNQEANNWATRVLEEINYERRNTHKEIMQCGYDIYETTLWLENFYLNHA